MLSNVPTFSLGLCVWKVVAEVSLTPCVSLAAAVDSAHLVPREGRGEATEENRIVSSNGGQSLVEFLQ